MKPTLLDRLNRLPPFLVVAVGQGRDGLTLEGIAELSCLPLNAVRRIACLDSWSNVTVGEAVDFATACRVDLWRQKPTLDYLRHTLQCKVPLPHLTVAQRSKVAKMMK